MATNINIYKTAAYSDAYSEDGAMDDPIWSRDSFSWDGAAGETKDIQLYARNDGDIPALSVVLEVIDIVGEDESTWSKLASTQAGLDGASWGGSLNIGDLAPAATATFWLRIAVPEDTDPEDKTDLRLRATASISSSSSSSSESSWSSSSSNSSSSASSESSISSSCSSCSSGSAAGYSCSDSLLCVAHWPYNNVYIYDMLTWTLLMTIPTAGEYGDGVTMYEGDVIVGDSKTGMIYIHAGTSSSIQSSLSASRITGLDVYKNNLIETALDDDGYPHGWIRIHKGRLSSVSSSFQSPEDTPHAACNDGENLLTTDRWAKRIYIHSGATRTVSSKYDNYEPNGDWEKSDIRGLAFDNCGNLLEYDARAKKLYVHVGTTSVIQATLSFDYEFTGIGTPQASWSSSSSENPYTPGVDRGAWNLVDRGAWQKSYSASSSSSSSA